jgi:hypothetical protein
VKWPKLNRLPAKYPDWIFPHVSNTKFFFKHLRNSSNFYFFTYTSRPKTPSLKTLRWRSLAADHNLNHLRDRFVVDSRSTLKLTNF